MRDEKKKGRKPTPAKPNVSKPVEGAAKPAPAPAGKKPKPATGQTKR